MSSSQTYQNIGRLTGKDVKAGKNIRKDARGFEVFDDYFSDTESEGSAFDGSVWDTTRDVSRRASPLVGRNIMVMTPFSSNSSKNYSSRTSSLGGQSVVVSSKSISHDKSMKSRDLNQTDTTRKSTSEVSSESSDEQVDTTLTKEDTPAEDESQEHPPSETEPQNNSRPSNVEKNSCVSKSAINEDLQSTASEEFENSDSAENEEPVEKSAVRSTEHKEAESEGETDESLQPNMVSKSAKRHSRSQSIENSRATPVKQNASPKSAKGTFTVEKPGAGEKKSPGNVKKSKLQGTHTIEKQKPHRPLTNTETVEKVQTNPAGGTYTKDTAKPKKAANRTHTLERKQPPSKSRVEFGSEDDVTSSEEPMVDQTASSQNDNIETESSVTETDTDQEQLSEHEAVEPEEKTQKANEPLQQLSRKKAKSKTENEGSFESDTNMVAPPTKPDDKTDRVENAEKSAKSKRQKDVIQPNASKSLNIDNASSSFDRTATGSTFGSLNQLGNELGSISRVDNQTKISTYMETTNSALASFRTRKHLRFSEEVGPVKPKSLQAMVVEHENDKVNGKIAGTVLTQTADSNHSKQSRRAGDAEEIETCKEKPTRKSTDAEIMKLLPNQENMAAEADQETSVKDSEVTDDGAAEVSASNVKEDELELAVTSTGDEEEDDSEQAAVESTNEKGQNNEQIIDSTNILELIEGGENQEKDNQQSKKPAPVLKVLAKKEMKRSSIEEKMPTDTTNNTLPSKKAKRKTLIELEIDSEVEDSLQVQSVLPKISDTAEVNLAASQTGGRRRSKPARKSSHTAANSPGQAVSQETIETGESTNDKQLAVGSGHPKGTTVTRSGRAVKRKTSLESSFVMDDPKGHSKAKRRSTSLTKPPLNQTANQQDKLSDKSSSTQVDATEKSEESAESRVLPSEETGETTRRSSLGVVNSNAEIIFSDNEDDDFVVMEAPIVQSQTKVGRKLSDGRTKKSPKTTKNDRKSGNAEAVESENSRKLPKATKTNKKSGNTEGFESENVATTVEEVEDNNVGAGKVVAVTRSGRTVKRKKSLDSSFILDEPKAHSKAKRRSASLTRPQLSQTANQNDQSINKPSSTLMDATEKSKGSTEASCPPTKPGETTRKSSLVVINYEAENVLSDDDDLVVIEAPIVLPRSKATKKVSDSKPKISPKKAKTNKKSGNAEVLESVNASKNNKKGSESDMDQSRKKTKTSDGTIPDKPAAPKRRTSKAKQVGNIPSSSLAPGSAEKEVQVETEPETSGKTKLQARKSSLSKRNALLEESASSPAPVVKNTPTPRRASQKSNMNESVLVDEEVSFKNSPATVVTQEDCTKKTVSKRANKRKSVEGKMTSKAKGQKAQTDETDSKELDDEVFRRYSSALEEEGHVPAKATKQKKLPKKKPTKGQKSKTATEESSQVDKEASFGDSSVPAMIEEDDKNVSTEGPKPKKSVKGRKSTVSNDSSQEDIEEVEEDGEHVTAKATNKEKKLVKKVPAKRGKSKTAYNESSSVPSVPAEEDDEHMSPKASIQKRSVNKVPAKGRKSKTTNREASLADEISFRNSLASALTEEDDTDVPDKDDESVKANQKKGSVKANQRKTRTKKATKVVSSGKRMKSQKGSSGRKGMRNRVLAKSVLAVEPVEGNNLQEDQQTDDPILIDAPSKNVAQVNKDKLKSRKSMITFSPSVKDLAEVQHLTACPQVQSGYVDRARRRTFPGNPDISIQAKKQRSVVSFMMNDSETEDKENNDESTAEEMEPADVSDAVNDNDEMLASGEAPQQSILKKPNTPHNARRRSVVFTSPLSTPISSTSETPRAAGNSLLRRSQLFQSTPIEPQENRKSSTDTPNASNITSESIKHYFEMTNSQTPVVPRFPKKKVLAPTNEDDGLRRSRRNRLKPLAFYKNERPDYRRESDGFVIAGVISPGLDMTKIEKERRRKMVQRRRNHKKTKIPETPRRLSTHDILSDSVAITDIGEIPVIDHNTEDEVMQECIFDGESYQFINGRGKEATDADDYIITRPLKHAAFSSGYLLIRPLKEKPMHKLSVDNLIFSVVRGKVAITINRSTAVLESGDKFWVPCGNVYSIRNLRKDTAKLDFTSTRHQS